MLFHHFRLLDLKLSVGIKVELDDSVVDHIRPFTFGDETLWVAAQCLDEGGNLAVSPRDQDFVAVSMGREVFRDRRWIFVSKTGVDLLVKRGCKRLNCQSWSVALFAVGGGKDMIEMERLPINFVLLEVVDVSFGSLFARFRETIADLRLFCVPDDEDDFILEEAIFVGLVDQKGSEEQARSHTDIVAQGNRS